MGMHHHDRIPTSVACGQCRVTDTNGKVFLDTKNTGRPILLTLGGRPFSGGLCLGAEEALFSMKAGPTTHHCCLLAMQTLEHMHAAARNSGCMKG